MAERASARLAALFAFAGACAAPRTAPAPEAEARRGGLVVRAESAELAARGLALCEQCLPAVLELPGTRAPDALEVHVRAARGAGSGATRWRGALERREAAWVELALDTDPDAQRFLAGHELAHAALDRTWQRLPVLVEEGLADRAGERAAPGYAARRRLLHAVHLASWTGAGLVVGNGVPLVARLDEDALLAPEALLALDARSYQELRPEANRELAYAFGYLLVERIGLERLRELCAAAERAGRVTLGARELFEAAGLDPRQRRAWAPAVEALALPRP